MKVTTTGGFIKKSCLLVALTVLSISSHAADKSTQDNLSKPTKPNFVWIVSEDNSMHYQELFFEGGAKTPNIAKLAHQAPNLSP